MSELNKKEQLAKHISLEVKKFRKKHKIKQRELSQKLYISQSKLSKIEQGRARFDAETFLLFLKFRNELSSNPSKPDLFTRQLFKSLLFFTD